MFLVLAVWQCERWCGMGIFFLLVTHWYKTEKESDREKERERELQVHSFLKNCYTFDNAVTNDSLRWI